MSVLSSEAVLAGLREAQLIKQGKRPTSDELAIAPVLSGWALEEACPGLHRLVGYVRGHPTIPDGWCTTSVALVMDTQQKWVRTVSRIYVLEDPLLGNLVSLS